MYNMEYYGFSLLCRVQQICNSHFSERRSFSGASSDGVAAILNPRTYSRGLLSGCILDFSLISREECPESIRRFDLVDRYFNGELSPKLIEYIGEACKVAELEEELYRVSQWVPDRKRSTLIMVSPGSCKAGGTNWLAVSLGGYEAGRVADYGGVTSVLELQRALGIERLISDYEILIDSRKSSVLCESFMEIARISGSF